MEGRDLERRLDGLGTQGLASIYHVRETGFPLSRGVLADQHGGS